MYPFCTNMLGKTMIHYGLNSQNSFFNMTLIIFLISLGISVQLNLRANVEICLELWSFNMMIRNIHEDNFGTKMQSLIDVECFLDWLYKLLLITVDKNLNQFTIMNQIGNWVQSALIIIIRLNWNPQQRYTCISISGDIFKHKGVE